MVATLIGCAGQGEHKVSAADSAFCSVSEISRQSLTVDGRPVYVNAQVLSASGQEIMIAGLPNYLWNADGSLREVPVIDSIFGVTQSGDRIRFVPSPIPGRAVTPHAVPIAGGGWHIVFAEVSNATAWVRGDTRESIRKLWYGTFVGGRWSELYPLPFPKGYRIDRAKYGSIATYAGTVGFAAIVEPDHGLPPDRVILFELSKGAWLADIVAVESGRGHPQPYAVSEVSLQPSVKDGPLLIVRRDDPASETPNFGSVFSYHSNHRQWFEKRVIAGLSSPGSSQFAAVAGVGPDVVVWMDDSQLVAYVGELDGRGLRPVVPDGLIQSSDTRVMRVDETPLLISQNRPGSRLDPSIRTAIRFFALTDTTIISVGTIPSPFAQFQAASSLSEEEILLSGGHILTDQRDGLFSTLLMRVRVSCTHAF